MKPENKPLIITFLFILLIIYFLFSGFSPSPEKSISELSLDWYIPKTAREKIMKTKTLVGNCFICHMGLVPDPDVIEPQFTHKSIELAHGKNKRCYNCHLIRDRNLFTPDYGPGIVHRQVENLCARCHGIIYNDWVNGTHGSKRGYWQNSNVFNTKTFVCTQCHDPHSPQFKFKEYAPSPVWPEKFIRHRTKKHETAKVHGTLVSGKEKS